jgi:class 3 adenylate cyclase
MDFLLTNESGNVSGEHHGDMIGYNALNPEIARQFIASAEKLGISVDLSLPLIPNAVVLFDLDSLIAYCKEHGYMLYANENSRTISHEVRINWGNTPMCCLPQAVALRPSESREPSGITHRHSRLWIPSKLLDILNDAVRLEDGDAPRVTSLMIKRVFVYIDVSDFSKLPPGQEVLVINSLVRIVQNSEWWQGRARALYKCFEAMLCIGDGFIFAFKPPSVAATYFAAYLAQLVEVAVAKHLVPVDFHFRMGVHVGEVYSFWDVGRQGWNYIGDGINGGNRVLAAIGKDTDDVLFVSSQVRQAMIGETSKFEFAPTVIAHLHNRGRRADKHGNPWRVYEVSHTALCHSDLPGDLQR